MYRSQGARPVLEVNLGSSTGTDTNLSHNHTTIKIVYAGNLGIFESHFLEKLALIILRRFLLSAWRRTVVKTKIGQGPLIRLINNLLLRIGTVG